MELRVRDGGHYWYRLMEADVVLSAMSARDTEALWREASPSLAEAAAGVSYSPCWALMAAFTTGLQLPYQVRRSPHWAWG